MMSPHRWPDAVESHNLRYRTFGITDRHLSGKHVNQELTDVVRRGLYFFLTCGYPSLHETDNRGCVAHYWSMERLLGSGHPKENVPSECTKLIRLRSTFPNGPFKFLPKGDIQRGAAH